MNLLEEFTTLTTQYDESLFQVFKKIVDSAKMEALKKNLDSISTFILVNDTLQSAYIKLALATGIIEKEQTYNEAHISLIMSERLLEKIYTYIEPITQMAREGIREKAENILETTSLDELQKEYNDLISLLSNKTIQKNSYVYEDIQFTKKGKN